MFKQKKVILLIFIAALILRLGWVFITGSHIHPQVWEYELLADNLLAGRGFTFNHLGTVYRSFASPLYPFLCAFIYLITNHSYLIMMLAQACISASICVLIFGIAENIFGNYAAVLSALLAAFHPGLIVYTTKLHPLALDAFLITLVAFLFLRLKINLSLRNQIFTGSVAGLCVLTRSTIGLFLPFGLTWLFYRTSYRKWKVFFGGVLVILAASIVILPWMVRNYKIHGKFISIQTTVQENFWRGNNQNATGSSYRLGGQTVLQSAPPGFLAKIYSLDEIGQSEFFQDEAFKFIRQHPIEALRLFFKKFYYFWWFSPISGIEYPKLYLSLYKLFYSVLFPFAIFGIIFALNSKEEGVKDRTYLLLLLFLTIAIAQSLFYVEGRHRWAIEPLFLIFTVNGVIGIKNEVKKCLKMKT